MTLSGKAGDPGIGATEFSKASGRSELQLAAEACLAAIKDAGLSPSEVDGLVTFTADGNSEIAVARELGIPGLRFFSRVDYGGGAACGTIAHAAMAVATGQAEVVVCYRAFNERSGAPVRPGQQGWWERRHLDRAGVLLASAVRLRHPGRLGRHAGPALPASLWCHQ
jgi:Acetyl-CoA acetyltransferase